MKKLSIIATLFHLASPTIPVHEFYSNECCDNTHCHPVPCDEVEDVNDGWRWQRRYFSKAMLRVSPDGACHVCTSTAPLCIYLPPRS